MPSGLSEAQDRGRDLVVGQARPFVGGDHQPVIEEGAFAAVPAEPVVRPGRFGRPRFQAVDDLGEAAEVDAGGRIDGQAVAQSQKILESEAEAAAERRAAAVPAGPFLEQEAVGVDDDQSVDGRPPGP